MSISAWVMSDRFFISSIGCLVACSLPSMEVWSKDHCVYPCYSCSVYLAQIARLVDISSKIVSNSTNWAFVCVFVFKFRSITKLSTHQRPWFSVFFFSSECYITEIRYISHPAFNITVHKHLKGVDDKSEDKSSFYSEKTKTNLLGLFPSSSRSEQIQMWLEVFVPS